MLDLNPIVKSHTPLPESSSVAFYKSVPDADKPPATGPITSPLPVFKIVEATSGIPEDSAGGSWRGGWASRFIPDEISYETGMQHTEDGLITITHAPMGVRNVTRWMVREAEEGGLVVEKRGEVISNRMLMGFIRTTIKESYEKLARDFVAELERRAAIEKKDGIESEKGSNLAEEAIPQQGEVEVVA